MANTYNLQKIRMLLTEGFTDSELRRFCYDNSDFRPVYYTLAANTGKDEIVNQLIEYADRKGLFEHLLSWAKEQNPTRYAQYKPYQLDHEGKSTSSQAPPSSESKGVTIGNVEGGIQGSIIAGRDITIIRHSQPEIISLRIDAAVPNQVVLGRVFDLAVSVRQRSSPILDEYDLTQVRSGDVQVSWPESEPFIHLHIQINAPECEIHGGDSRSFRLYKGQNSPVFYFQLIPKKKGETSIIVTVYQQDDWLGSARIHTVAYKQVAGKVKIAVTSHSLPEQGKSGGDRSIIRRILFFVSHKWFNFETNSHKTRGFTMSNQLETRKDGIRKLITEHRRRQQELKVQQAKYGISVDPHIPIEIQDIEAEIEKLQAELRMLESNMRQESRTTPVPPRTTLSGDKVKVDKTALRETIVTKYSLEQIKTLSEDCGVDYENLGQSSKEALARELVREMERRGQLALLDDKVRQK